MIELQSGSSVSTKSCIAQVLGKREKGKEREKLLNWSHNLENTVLQRKRGEGEEKIISTS